MLQLARERAPFRSHSVAGGIEVATDPESATERCIPVPVEGVTEPTIDMDSKPVYRSVIPDPVADRGRLSGAPVADALKVDEEPMDDPAEEPAEEN